MKKILLVCNAGMSSSILIKKIQKAAASKGVEVDVQARSMNGLSDEVGNWDVCLIGPQIVYALDSVKSTLNIPVESVEPRVYAIADGNAALDQALKLYNEKDD